MDNVRVARASRVHASMDGRIHHRLPILRFDPLLPTSLESTRRIVFQDDEVVPHVAPL